MAKAEEIRLALQAVENLEGLRRDAIRNAQAYKSAVAAGRPLAEIIAVMRADASEYGRRLDWILNATQTTRINTKLISGLTAIGLVRADLVADYGDLRTVANQQTNVTLTDGPSINAAADSVISFLPSRDMLW